MDLDSFWCKYTFDNMLLFVWD